MTIINIIFNANKPDSELPLYLNFSSANSKIIPNGENFIYKNNSALPKISMINSLSSVI